MILKVRHDRLPFTTGVVTERLFPASQLLAEFITLRAAAQQGDRRPQRLRARGRHPPGRRAQGADHLRDHGPADGRRAREPHRARQAQRPARARASAASTSGTRSRANSSTRSTAGSSRLADQKKRLVDEEIAEIADEVVNADGRRPSAAVRSRLPGSAVSRRRCEAERPGAAGRRDRPGGDGAGGAGPRGGGPDRGTISTFARRRSGAPRSSGRVRRCPTTLARWPSTPTPSCSAPSVSPGSTTTRPPFARSGACWICGASSACTRTCARCAPGPGPKPRPRCAPTSSPAPTW